MGRVHRRLVELLETKGFRHIHVEPQKGHWRSSPYADVVRWEGSALFDDHNVPVYSWDTMTDCVKHGIRVSGRNEGTAGFGYEIVADRRSIVGRPTHPRAA